MYKAAIEEFDKALSVDSTEARAIYLKATSFLMLKDTLTAAYYYKKSAKAGSDPDECYLKAATFYYDKGMIKQANECINEGLKVRPKNFDFLLFKSKISYERGEYNNAFLFALEALKIKDMAIGYYYSGISAYKLGKIEQAEKDFEKAIGRDGKFADSYLELAKLQIEQKKFDYAIDNCSMVLLLINPENTDALFIRSRAYRAQNLPEQALSDVSKAISINKNNWQLYMCRAQYNIDYAHYSDAINDYTLALNLNDTLTTAYKNRAYANEQVGNLADARKDYQKLLVFLEKKKTTEVQKQFVQQKIFDLGKEANKPSIEISQPQLTENQSLKIIEGNDSISIEGIVKDESGLKAFKINNIQIQTTKSEDGMNRFKAKFPVKNISMITLSATDVYDNIQTASYAIARIEIQPPVITLTNPAAGPDYTIQLETGDKKIYLEGQILDKSLIKEIKVDEVNASYITDNYNPRFIATLDLLNRRDITISATDIFGNKTVQSFKLAPNGQLLSQNNPMGKTWAIIIENTEYKDFQTLVSPVSDMASLEEALGKYKISKILHKKNMTKREMEKFFSIDLRDLIVSNNVNSLFIWYAGHGKNENNTGYWIPVDAKINDEYSYYNINALKASFYSYTSLTHILVVSDACQAGENFSVAMRGDNSLASCSDAALMSQKSAMVLTSSYKEPAMDNSLFTQTFIQALKNNPADCIPIDAIAEQVSLVMYKNTSQKPVFGRISGLEDKNGTFFFIGR